MNIKNKRESKNLTQEELGQILGVNRSTVAMWETGEAFPRADKLPTLAKVLDCNIEDLFDTKTA